MIETLDSWDRQLFLWLNQIHHPLLDPAMFWISEKYLWFPFYGLLIYFLVREFKIQGVWTILALVVLVLITDQVASGLLKPMVGRLRPCHDPDLKTLTHMVEGCGGRYGFASSHASNAFGLTTFLFLLLKKSHPEVWILFIWAGLTAYSRIYLGVHYPGDILAGAFIGVTAAFLVYYLLKHFRTNAFKEN